MAKFELKGGTGNEQCVNCAETIKNNEKYLKLEQNRWAKPCLCKSCFNKLHISMNSDVPIVYPKPKKKITYKIETTSRNAWMSNW